MILNIILASVTGGAVTALVAVLLCRNKPKKKAKKQPQQEKTALEFSKRIFIGLALQVAVIVVFLCAVAWRTEDMSVTQALVDNAFDLLKIGVMSYFGKAALENRVKLAHFYPKLKKQIFGDGGSYDEQ